MVQPDSLNVGWNSLSDDELEAMIGPGFMTFLDMQTMETLARLADGDSAVAQEIWPGYLLWREAQP